MNVITETHKAIVQTSKVLSVEQQEILKAHRCDVRLSNMMKDFPGTHHEMKGNVSTMSIQISDKDQLEDAMKRVHDAHESMLKMIEDFKREDFEKTRPSDEENTEIIGFVVFPIKMKL